MGKLQVIYSIWYNRETGRVFNICKEGTAEAPTIAARICEVLNDDIKKAEKAERIRAHYHGQDGSQKAPDIVAYCFAYKQKEGRWENQRQALENAAENAGLYSIR